MPTYSRPSGIVLSENERIVSEIDLDAISVAFIQYDNLRGHMFKLECLQ